MWNHTRNPHQIFNDTDIAIIKSIISSVSVVLMIISTAGNEYVCKYTVNQWEFIPDMHTFTVTCSNGCSCTHLEWQVRTPHVMQACQCQQTPRTLLTSEMWQVVRSLMKRVPPENNKQHHVDECVKTVSLSDTLQSLCTLNTYLQNNDLFYRLFLAPQEQY